MCKDDQWEHVVDFHSMLQKNCAIGNEWNPNPWNQS